MTTPAPKKTKRGGKAAAPRTDDAGTEVSTETGQSTERREWQATPESKAKAARLRWSAGGLWLVAIMAEAVSIFWLLRQREVDTATDRLTRDPDTGLLRTQEAAAHFPQWAFYTLLGVFVVIGALSISGSLLWKKANRLDPARRSETVRFFVQNQLGAIIAIIAFVPLIVMVFLNKDMDKKQKGIAGAVGIVIAVIATAVGIDYNPPSIEKYTADQSTVIQLLGKDEVVWVAGGQVYHVCDSVSDIQTGSDKHVGTTAEAVEAGKSRLTLKFASELRACGLSVPTNEAEIVAALREIQAGRTDTRLPAPVWANPADAPVRIDDAPRN